MLHCLYVCGVRRRRRESSLPNKIGTTPGPKPRPVEERFWEKVGPHDDPTKCWLTDYHVVIPEGMTIDHVKARGCTSTLCVNPHHLEMVTQKVNVLRGDAPSAICAKQTHCIHGHLFNKENTYVYPSGSRRCRVCLREQYYAKKKVLSCA